MRFLSTVSLACFTAAVSFSAHAQTDARHMTASGATKQFEASCNNVSAAECNRNVSSTTTANAPASAVPVPPNSPNAGIMPGGITGSPPIGAAGTSNLPGVTGNTGVTKNTGVTPNTGVTGTTGTTGTTGNTGGSAPSTGAGSSATGTGSTTGGAGGTGTMR